MTKILTCVSCGQPDVSLEHGCCANCVVLTTKTLTKSSRVTNRSNTNGRSMSAKDYAKAETIRRNKARQTKFGVTEV